MAAGEPPQRTVLSPRAIWPLLDADTRGQTGTISALFHWASNQQNQLVATGHRSGEPAETWAWCLLGWYQPPERAAVRSSSRSESSVLSCGKMEKKGIVLGRDSPAGGCTWLLAGALQAVETQGRSCPPAQSSSGGEGFQSRYLQQIAFPWTSKGN